MQEYFDRSIALTGALSPPVIVNSNHFLRTESYSVQMNADIKLDKTYMQGGPGKAVADISKKIISGQFTTPLKISESNTFSDALVDLIESAKSFDTVLSLATLLNPYNPQLIAEGDPYLQPNYSLIFDTCLLEKFSIKAAKSGDIKIESSVKGMVDVSNTSPITIPPEDANIYRNLTWYDCLFSRDNSQLENAEEIEISINKTIDEKYFLMTCSEGGRTDAPYSLGITGVDVTFKIVEYISSVFDTFSYSLGGFYNGFNFSGNIGPLNFNIPNALLKISSETLSSDIIRRTTEGYYRMAPNTVYDPDFVFSL